MIILPKTKFNGNSSSGCTCFEPQITLGYLCLVAVHRNDVGQKIRWGVIDRQVMHAAEGEVCRDRVTGKYLAGFRHKIYLLSNFDDGLHRWRWRGAARPTTVRKQGQQYSQVSRYRTRLCPSRFNHGNQSVGSTLILSLRHMIRNFLRATCEKSPFQEPSHLHANSRSVMQWNSEAHYFVAFCWDGAHHAVPECLIF